MCKMTLLRYYHNARHCKKQTIKTSLLNFAFGHSSHHGYILLNEYVLGLSFVKYDKIASVLLSVIFTIIF